MRITAVVNQKGGSGKTTTAINLAAVYARRGLRTLLVDMDPQAHCSAGLGVPDGQLEMSIGDALLADLGPNFDPTPLLWEVARNFHLAPSTMRLAALESPNGGLYALPDRDRRLANLLKILSSRFDRCLIDCPPTIGMLTYNALRAARETLIPVETGFFSMRGAEKQWTTIHRLIERLDRPIACHILPTIHRTGSKLSREILGSLRKRFAGQIIPMEIEEHDELRESASFGQPVVEYAPNSPAHLQFERLADWLEDHIPTGQVEIEVMRPSTAPTSSMATQVFARSATPQRGTYDSAPADVFNDPRDNPDSDTTLPRVPAMARPIGARAAEMALRVRSLVQVREEQSQQRETAREESAEHGAMAQTVEATPEQMETMEQLPRPAVMPDPQLPRQSCVMLEPPVPQMETESQVSEAAQTAREHEIVTQPAQSTTKPAAGSIESVYGVRQVSDGVLFVQPGFVGSRVCIAGDFNGWSTDATPLRFDPVLKVHHAIIHIAQGRHRYRLVVDGRWVTDQYNPIQERNSFGEANSVLDVTTKRRES